MGRPIIIDDGGSIRITYKEKRPVNSRSAAGKMDGLLDVKEISGDPLMKWMSEDKIFHRGRPGGHVSIAWVENNGKADNIGPNVFGTIEIFTDSGQIIKATKRLANKLTIQVYSNDAEPIIESKSNKQQRSYAAVNGGNITEVKIDNTVIVDLNDPNSPITDAVYIGIIIT